MMENKNSVGRPSKYRKEFNTQAEKLCLLGATDNQLADFFEVDAGTLNAWKKAHPEFHKSLKRGKEIADMQVAHTLFQKAIGGYKIRSEKAFVDRFGTEHVITVEDDAIPDTTAIIFWLKNRQPDKWREKQNVDIDFAKLSTEELNIIINQLILKNEK